MVRVHVRATFRVGSFTILLRNFKMSVGLEDTCLHLRNLLLLFENDQKFHVIHIKFCQKDEEEATVENNLSSQ